MSTELQSKEQILLDLLSRFRPQGKIHFVRAAKVYRIGELAAHFQMPRVLKVAHAMHLKALSMMGSKDYWNARQEANIACRWRHIIDNKDEEFCCECGVKTRLSVDHVIPVFLGGNSKAENLRWMCMPCNMAKGAKFDPMAILCAFHDEASPWNKSLETLSQSLIGQGLG